MILAVPEYKNFARIVGGCSCCTINMTDRPMNLKLHAVKRTAFVLAVFLSMSALSSCSFVKMGVAQVQPRDRFLPLRTNPGVRYAPGSEAIAERVAAALDRSLAIVEQSHGSSWSDPPQLFVCDAECFSTFVPVSKEVAAAQFGRAIFMNDAVLKLREQHKNVPVESFLTHELAHLLLYQRAGATGYIRVPSWFREGIAVAVSNGAGAEGCTPQEAAQSVVEGKHFNPPRSAASSPTGLHRPTRCARRFFTVKRACSFPT